MYNAGSKDAKIQTKGTNELVRNNIKQVYNKQDKIDETGCWNGPHITKKKKKRKV